MEKLNWQGLLGTMLGDAGDLKTLILETKNTGRETEFNLRKIEKCLDNLNDKFKEVTKAYNDK